MITHNELRLKLALRYSAKFIGYSACCWALAFLTVKVPGVPQLPIPTTIVTILGTALAIILGFKNSSAYERWWEARIIWGGVVNESRTFARQLLTFLPDQSMARDCVRAHLAWVNAMKLQLRSVEDETAWKEQVGDLLNDIPYDQVLQAANRVTRIMQHRSRMLKKLHAGGTMETLLYVQLDDTMTRLTDLQGRAERIRTTPLPRPYDYYTLAFLNIFILFFPFAFIHDLAPYMQFVLLPVTIVIGWIFYQIYVFGKILSQPFQNWRTDVPLDAIANTIEIDLEQMIGGKAPAKMHPVDGVLM